MYDILIIGTGPAGLSAAIYGARANLRVLAVGKDGGALQKAEKIDNYFGVTDSPGGTELWQRGVEQAQALGAEVKTAEITGVEYTGGYTVHTTAGSFEGKTLVFAMGNARKKPDIRDIEKYEGRGVSYCAVCDAFFFRGKNVAVLGNGNYALHEAEFLKNVAASVTVLTNGKPSEGIEDFEVIGDRISHLSGEDSLGAVHFESGSSLELDGLFVAEGFAGASELANKLGVMSSGGFITVDDNGVTNLPGCFAAGDCIGGTLQVASAVSEGAKAALSAIKYVRTKK
ncbi:MAG: NAD(P)/FAD-dependent oxidoreductase [Clostridia bacterium]|nr:NAD(P)/FAD-dependent oxidoreductase [Clostridia bacterium]